MTLFLSFTTYRDDYSKTRNSTFFVGLLKYVIYACNFLALGLYVITIDDFLKIKNGANIGLTIIQGDICYRNEMSHTYSIDIIFNFHQELLIILLSAFLLQITY